MNYNEAKKIFEELFNNEMSESQMRDFLVNMRLICL